MTNLKLQDETRSYQRQQWNSLVVAYFDACSRDYLRFWTDEETLSMHIGYWDENTRTHAESLANMNRELAKRASLHPRELVLDVGCGVGGPALWLAQTYGVRVIGITLPEHQVSLARKFARDRQLERLVSFYRMDFHHLAFADASFDVIWAQESVGHSPDKARFFAEANRVLKPKGRLIMEDLLRRARPYSEKDERFLARGLAGWAMPDIPTREEYVALAGEGGFCDVKVEEITAHVIPSARRMYLISTLIYPFLFVRHPFRRLDYFWKLSHSSQDEVPSKELFSNIRFRNIRTARLQWRALNRNLAFPAILSASKRGQID